MKKLILALALILPALAQADLKNPTVSMCRDAVNAMSYLYAYNTVCGQGADNELNQKMSLFTLRGCTSKVSLNDIRLAIARDLEIMQQLNYETPRMSYFCQNDEVIKERNDAYMVFNNSMTPR